MRVDVQPVLKRLSESLVAKGVAHGGEAGGGVIGSNGFSFEDGVLELDHVALAKALSECSLLFLGQDLLDWTLRILLNGLRSGKATMPSSWAVQLSPSKVAIELWRHRGVEILDLPLDVYAPELLRRLHEFDVAAVPA